MADELDSFLDGEDAGQAEVHEPSAAVKSPEDSRAAADETREATAPEAAVRDEDEELPDDRAGLLEAIQKERSKRKDYKGERDRLAGEKAAMQAELEQLRKAAPAAQPAAAQQPPPSQPQARGPRPNAMEDPEGAERWDAEDKWNDRLNWSEAILRGQHDDADVDAKIALFRKALAETPSLFAEFRQQVHPYGWLFKKAQQIADIQEKTSPEYQAKREAEIRADERARIEAEYNGTAAARPAAARVNLPQSLGTARSAAPRQAAVLNVPESFEDILNTPRR